MWVCVSNEVGEGVRGMVSGESEVEGAGARVEDDHSRATRLL